MEARGNPVTREVGAPLEPQLGSTRRRFSERSRASASVLAAVVVAGVLAVTRDLALPTASPVGGAVIVLLVYLVVYLTLTGVVFSHAGAGDI